MTPTLARIRVPGAALIAVGIALIILANVRPFWWGFPEDQIERVGLVSTGLGWLIYVLARRATLRQLNINASELHLLAAQMPANVWTTDRELRLTSVFGTLIRQLENPSARVPGRTLYDIFGTRDETHPAIAAHLRALRGESVPYERVAGDLIVEGQVEPLRDGRGHIIGCVGAVIDVSTWRWAESQVRRFGALVQSSEDAIVSTDLDGTIKSWNPAAERLYGYAAAEAIGKSIAIIAPPGGEAEFERNALALRQGTALGPYEARRIRSDGQGIWVSVTVSPIMDGGGQVVGISGIIRDITDRKRAEAEVVRLASFPQMNPTPIVEVDAAGNVSYMNPAAERLLPNLREAPSLHPFVAGAWVFAGESQRAGRRLHSREVRVGETWYLQDISTLSDGSHLRIYAADMTERRRAEETVRESERRFRTVLDSMRMIGLGLDAAGRITYCNDYLLEVTGWPSGEAIGGDWFDRFIPPDSGLREIFARGIATGAMPVHHRNEILTRAGARRLIEWDNTLLRDAEGRVSGTVSIGVDVTERTKAEHELRQSEERLRALAQHLESAREEEHTRMAREIHDELAQSLTALRLDLSWLSRKMPDAGSGVRAKIAEMVTLTDATIEAGRRIAAELRPPILDDLGLIAALEWYVQDFAKHAKLRATLDAGPKELALDGRLAVTAYRIVQEALANVARHAEARSVTVRLGEQEGALLLEISDDGKGIHADAVGSVQSFGIIGMRERAAVHGGALEVGSSPAGGTVVRATIPLERRGEPQEQG
jgi:PAS domain S-box-containing protein